MRVLIVEGDAELGAMWQRFLQRRGKLVRLVSSAEAAFQALSQQLYEIVILDLILSDGSPLAVADYAAVRHPSARIVCVTGKGVFADGSIFNHAANACSLMPEDMDPDDLDAVIDYYGGQASTGSAAQAPGPSPAIAY